MFGIMLQIPKSRGSGALRYCCCLDGRQLEMVQAFLVRTSIEARVVFVSRRFVDCVAFILL